MLRFVFGRRCCLIHRQLEYVAESLGNVSVAAFVGFQVCASNDCVEGGESGLLLNMEFSHLFPGTLKIPTNGRLEHVTVQCYWCLPV
mmetsp:Transcript_43492/g.78144  ORF Transcript_43492/g.78144 Transcript_43492/m.78144 type:complete len:87 (+) Transcript_43492:467-727(+)